MIPVWCIIYNTVLTLWGILSVKVLKMLAWVTPAVVFNNTTALPLLLVESLNSAGLFYPLLMSEKDTQSNAVKRATTYLLVNSVAGNCLTFAVGPQMLNAHEEDTLEISNDANQNSERDVEGEDSPDIEHHASFDRNAIAINNESDERTSSLPEAINSHRRKAQWFSMYQGKHF